MTGSEFVMVTKRELDELREKASALDPVATSEPEPTAGELLVMSFERFRAGQARKDRERRSS